MSKEISWLRFLEVWLNRASGAHDVLRQDPWGRGMKETEGGRRED